MSVSNFKFYFQGTLRKYFHEFMTYNLVAINIIVQKVEWLYVEKSELCNLRKLAHFLFYHKKQYDLSF